LLGRLEVLTAPPEAPASAMGLVHTAAHLDLLRDLSEAGSPAALTLDTAVSPDTYAAAAAATGGALAALDRIMDGEAANAFCVHRPPGHHAEVDKAMGFCYVNHVAVAARHLQRGHGLERVAIIDWDVHHGNGTQHIFESDPTVFYASIHQYPHYPGTGAAREIGIGPGRGTTLNIPAPAGWGDEGYLSALDGSLRPAVAAFEPQFILVSAGFDAHRCDPLAGMQVSSAGFGQMTDLVARLAADLCGGRLLSVLEGGYELEALGRCAAAHVEGLVRAARG